jgi:hypothetical protein
MATAKNFSFVFVGQSGRTYSISGYTADTAAYNCTFNPSGAAGTGSLNYWRAPENCTLVDFSIPTGTTQTSGYLTIDGAVKSGAVLDYVIHVSTNSNRPKLAVPIPAGSLVGKVTI